MSHWQALRSQQFSLVSGCNLALFRILFASIILIDVKRFIDTSVVQSFFELPALNFPYAFAEWITPLEGAGMAYLLYLLFFLLVLIVLGIFVSPSLLFFGLGFSYFFLSEQALYNNHLYLVCLLSFLLACTRSDNCLAIGRSGTALVPKWNYSILQWQIVLVYFFGGLAKLNADWILRAVPMRSALEAKASIAAILGDEASLQAASFLFAYSGLVFDLFIGGLLLARKTRPIAIVGVIMFNLTNAWIFDDISVFPYLMIASLVLFIEKPLFSPKTLKSREKSFSLNSNAIMFLIICYFLLQAILPLRHLAFPSNPGLERRGSALCLANEDSKTHS